MKSFKKIIYIALAFATVASTNNYPKQYDWQKEEHWDWSEINALDNNDAWQRLVHYFPKDFAWGVATSAFQIEGTQTTNGKHCKNSWTINPHLPQPGIATGHWTRFKEDITLIKNIGMTHYRFSIEWSKIMPEKDTVDHNAMQHYVDLVNELLAQGITPIPCLFHHAWPVWFDELGQFEKKENIKYFVQFAEYVFEHLKNKVSMWMTFNEPVGYALEGYYRGHYPPFKKSLKLCGKAVRNMLFSHVEVAMLFKSINPDVKVGFPKVFMPLDTYHHGYHPWKAKEKLATSVFNTLLHDSVLDFFKTGTFKWLMFVSDYHPDASKSLDFLGVNYYTHTILKNGKWFGKPETKNHKNAVMIGKREFYPEGLYRSIRKAHELAKALNIPLYIAENGVNDPDDFWKNEFLKKHLVIIEEAMAEGIDIRGYFWWTLMDSFSWNSGTDSKMGFYHVDDNLNRSLAHGVEPFINFVKAVQNQ